MWDELWFGYRWVRNLASLTCIDQIIVHSNALCGMLVGSARSSGLARVVALIRDVRMDLFPFYVVSGIRMRRTVLRDMSEVRSGVVDKLVSAFNETERLAKKSGKRVTRGAGGVPAKARWYHLMAYMAQTLDLVMRNAELNEINERLTETEKALDELQRTTPKTG